jgi:putative acetyltransferase
MNEAYDIRELRETDFSVALKIWEDSVKATHHFLPYGWVEEHRQIVLEKYFPMVSMFGIYDQQASLLGFSGVSDGNLEMLFIHPFFFGKGLGTLLLEHAVNVTGLERVDVNEQNQKALTFYFSQGFEIVSRSEFDAQGNPYPLLHLQLKK